jgi:HK97 family phage portal protein
MSSWWTRWRTELRSLFADPNTPAALGVWGAPSATGEPVSVSRAVGLSAVWACTSLIAGSIASMPLVLYRRGDEGREKATEHPLFDVLRVRPNPVMPTVAFYEALVTALLLRGNAFALITKDDDSRVRALWYVNPDRVAIEVLKTGRLKYKVSTPSGQTTVPEGGMLHITGPMSDDGYQGRSVISTFRETLGLGLAQERFSGEFFSNAATPRGLLTSPKILGDAARLRLKESLAAAHEGPGKRHKTLVLEEGLTWTALGISNEDSQLLESRRFTVEEIARIFAVPAAMVGGEATGSMTYSNVESRSLDYLKYTLGPWLARIESAINFACISPLERRQLYCEFLPDALLSTDVKSRYEAYTLGVTGGWLTLEEIRAKENLPPLAERDPAVG